MFVDSLILHGSLRSRAFAITCNLLLLLGAVPVRCATDGAVFFQAYTEASDSADIDMAFAVTGLPVPLRVDYRDRGDVFDLNLLGAATGMCSISEDCNACSYRDTNPCQVVDRYGADPNLCRLPNFLGGAASSDMLCGLGATAEATIVAPYGDGRDGAGDGSGSIPVATLNVFRTRSRTLVVTVTTRCGWVLLPSTSTPFNLTSKSIIKTKGSGSTDMQPPLVIMEGDLSYQNLDAYFAAPAQGPYELEVERYSCFSVELPLRGLPSKCQVLDLDMELRFAVQRVDVVDSDPGSEPACTAAGPVAVATASLKMSAPKGLNRVAAAARGSAAIATTKTASSDSLAKTAAAEVRQQLFSNGVAATTSYTAFLDPRDSQATAWMQSLSSQFPLLAITPATTSLSFLIGSLRRDARSGPTALSAAAGAGGDANAAAPLLPAGLYLESCGRQSISAVVAAVVSALSAQGVSERHVSDVVCLTSPYSAIAPAELPPCARYTSVLFNVTLQMSLSGDTAVTSSTSISALALSTSSSTSAIASSSSSSRSTTAGVADPQTLADRLVGAQLLAPWSCLSAEGQMRMLTQMELDLQLPRGPGSIQAVGSAVLVPSPSTVSTIPTTGPSSASLPAPPSGAAPSTSAPVPRSSDGGAAAAPATYPSSTRSFSTAATAAVAAVVALALVVALVAFFAIRSAQKSKAAAKVAAQAAAAATAAAAAATGAAVAPPLGKLEPLPPPKTPALDPEPSFASTYDGGEPILITGAAATSPSARGALPWASAASATPQAAVGAASPPGRTPAASSASLDPFAAAVEAAAAAASASAASAGPSSSYTTSEEVQDEEGESLSSVGLMRISTAAARAAAARAAAAAAATPEGAAAAPSAPAPPRLLPVTPPPPPPIARSGSDGNSRPAARLPTSPPGQPQALPTPAWRRRGRTLRLPAGGDSSSGSGTMGVIPEAAAEAAAGSAVPKGLTLFTAKGAKPAAAVGCQVASSLALGLGCQVSC